MPIKPFIQRLFSKLSGCHILIDMDAICIAITAETESKFDLQLGAKVDLNEYKENTLSKTDLSHDGQSYILLEIAVENSEFLKQSLDIMPAVVYTKAVDGRYLYANEEFFNVVPAGDNKVIGQSDTDFMPEQTANHVMKNDKEIVECGQVRYFEENVPHPDGTMRTYDTYKFPLFDKSGNIFAITGISIDMTERQKLQLEVETQRMLAVQATKMASLGEMAGGVSHEINNPLTVINGYTRKILRETSSRSIRKIAIAESAHAIDKMTDRIAKIIQGLRAFARDSEHDPFSLVPIEKIVRESLDMCEAKILSKNIQLKLDIKAHFQLNCRPSQIMQVIVNLLSNAFDAVAKDGSGFIMIQIERDQTGFVIRVSDNGPGIDDQNKKKIFEPFFTTKQIGKGTGLGLSISSSIMKGHNGHLHVRNNNPGVTFEAHFPLIETAPQVSVDI